MTFNPKPSPSSDGAPGPALAALLLGGFRRMVDLATAELAKRGHPEIRANHEFAMRAIEAGAGSAIELAGKLGTTKQAAAKTIATLEERGYVTRKADPADARRKALTITPRGSDMLLQGQSILNDVRREWQDKVGADRLAETENVLKELFGVPAEAHDTATWLDGAAARRPSRGAPDLREA